MRRPERQEEVLRSALLLSDDARERAVGRGVAVDVVVLVREQHRATGCEQPGIVEHDARLADQHAAAGPAGDEAVIVCR